MRVPPSELVPSPPLQRLIEACERLCEHACCGIDAFDFSSVHVASHVMSPSGSLEREDLVTLERAISDLESQATDLMPDEHGFICSIAGMNQSFTRLSLDAFLSRLRACIRDAPAVFDFARRLDGVASRNSPENSRSS